MPCNMVATVKSRIQLDAKVITQNEAALKMATSLVASALGIQPADVTVYSDRHTWHSGYSQWSGSGTVNQMTSLKTITAEKPTYIDFGAAKCCVRLHNDGNVELRDGWDLSKRQTMRQSGNDLQALVAAMLSSAIGTLNQYRVRSAIAAQFQITEEQRTPTGALVMTVEV